jgi:hypothetical protein
MNTGTPILPGAHKPGKVQAIAILTLGNGILNILWGLGMAGGHLWTIVCWPIGAYPIVLGVLEIVYAAKLLSANPGAVQPARYLGIMEICAVLMGNVVSLVVGILVLAFYDDLEVKAYFASLPAQPQIVN